MRKLLVLAIVALLMIGSTTGCRAMQTMPDSEKPFTPYDRVYQVTYDTLKEYGMIVFDRKYPALAEEGPGTIVAELPQSMELGTKTRTVITAYVRPYSFGYVDIEIAVEKTIDTADVGAKLAMAERPTWEKVARDKTLEVKIHNEIWNKLGGKYLRKKKPMLEPKYGVDDKGVEPSEAEKQISEALEKKINVNFSKADYASAIDQLRKLTGVNIVITGEAMDYLKQGKNGLTLKVAELEVYNVLNLMVENNKALTWDVRHGVILINIIGEGK